MLNQNHIYSSVDLDEINIQILNSLNAHIAIIDENGDLVACNEQWSSFRDAIYHKWNRPPLDENYLYALQKPLAEGSDFALRMLIGIKSVLSGEKRSFEANYPIETTQKKYWFKVTVNPLPQIDGAILIHEDISSQVHSRQDLRETHQKYQQYFENSLYGILVADESNQIIEANQKACAILDTTLEKLTYTSVLKYLNLDTNIYEVQKRINREGNYMGEHIIRDGNDRSTPVELSVNLFRNEYGIPVTIWSLKDISDKKKAEAAFKSSEQQYRLQFENSLEGIILATPNGMVLEANASACRILGYSKEELSNVHRNIVFDETLPENIKALNQRKLTGFFSGELLFVHKSGRHIPVEISSVIFKSESGQERSIVTFSDISDQKKTEKENKKNQKLYRQLFHNSPIGMVEINNNGKVVSTNKSFEKIFGFTQDEIFNKNLDEVIVPPFLDQQAETLSQYSFMGDSFQTEAVRLHKDGTEVPVLIGSVPVEINGEVISVFGMYVDISERKNLETQILDLLKTEKQARLRMEDMFEEAPSAIALLEGENHVFNFTNKKYNRLVNRTNLVGKKVKDVLPELEEQGFIQLLDEIYTTGALKNFKEQKIYLNQGNGNQQFYVDFVCKPLFNDQGKVYGIFSEIIDVTEQVEARNTIEKSLAEKVILLGEVHHRVKNNLAIISGLLELEVLNAPEPKVEKQLHHTRSRITSIAKIHELLYRNESLTHVYFNKYIEDVMSEDFTLPGNKDIALFSSFDLDEVNLNVNQAIPTGMLLNELINYLIEDCDYTDDIMPCIQLSLKEDQGNVYIELCDTSKALLKQINLDSDTYSLQAELIKVLLTQIQGSIDLSIQEDHILKISFSKREAKGPHSALKKKF